MQVRCWMLGAAAAALAAPAAMAGRGSDGQVNVIMWQAPSTMNPYLSPGTKDIIASSIALEPLASFTPQGGLAPRLAAEIPSRENGGIAPDLRSVTWKLKPGIRWADGSPLTAEDVAFTAAYCMDPSGGCAQLAKFEGVESVEALDALTVRIRFATPRSDPFSAFVGAQTPVLQKAQFRDCIGEKAPTCTQQNFNPVGTGPFKVVAFRTNDSITFEANPEYRASDQPAFAKLLIKGGGDAAAAARAVLETGEFDYAWNTQLAPDVMAGMEAAGKGQNVVAFGSLVERIHVNLTDPSPDLPEGERSTAKHPHPILQDANVRKALSMAIDRQLLTELGYGPAGQPSCNLVPAPDAWASDNTDCMAQDVEGAKRLLDEAGWLPGPDGIREKDGRRLKLLFQSSVNAVRQDFQALIKQWWSDIGVETELKVVEPSVFFGGDAGSPDTFQKFHADVEMYANNFEGNNPEPYLARQTCDKIPGPENQWQGENTSRYCDPEFDRLIGEMTQIVDPAARGAMGKRLNEMLTRDSNAIIPLVYRGTTSAVSNRLGGVQMNAWDSELWNVADWHRIEP
ncbi:peptide/nickel transport system substrate-binding protein [Paracoccus aminovorans]|uniref:Peptide/nickel transport system substrate-binding protein n=1 Tax=Paracoccus aminovorans TaxID=34004 RepID=A0A1I3C150_9RHOB|nr:peptide ABC transporter substrate-binding protein [Paracoccus aminovorans]CQR87041.1 dipeptide ABC transporter periplasmic component [Paracoccus aminovorans]SFH68046.1 peptide/nickel transport system substrate-binding protein [Paracoccus aminovorans]